MIASWLLDLTAQALHDSPSLDEYAGRVSDSGEGRWTVQAAVEEGVPAPVLAASLFDRFASRGEAEWGNRVLSAMRMALRRPSGEEPRAVTETAPPQQQEENPLEEGLALRRTPDPCALVIFGASGDLTHKKLMPALYALAVRRLLPPRFAIVGVARTEGDDETFRAGHAERRCSSTRATRSAQDVWDELAAQLHYVATDFADAGGENELHDLLGRLDDEQQLGGNRVFYLAVPPPAFPTIVEALGKRRDARGWTRLIVEKPFGHDLESARTLTAKLLEYFREDEIFRIDHYLGKETVQNMLALRLRERHLRADLEPPVHRPRPDHGRRVDRDRGPRRRTTSRPARCATSSRTTCCSCSR